MQTSDIVIVGAGHAAAQVGISLRQHKYKGRITVIGNEPEFPYERPPLSKEYLAGDKPFERLLICSEALWLEREITFLLKTHVTAVYPATKTLTFADGGTHGYGKLIWAAGGDPRKLNCPGHDLSGIHYVRNKADADAVMAALPNIEHVAVIGGGYIGLEAAAVLTKLGKHVVLLEALPRVLARVAGEELSRFFEAEHRAHGVDLRTGVGVDAFIGDAGHVAGVMLADGTEVPADMVIVGIGIIPAVQPLLAVGAKGGNGVEVDDLCRTSLSDVYAVGDCAAHANHFAEGAVIRLESVQNASDQATMVAKEICGDPRPYHATPWFWSNQYDLRLQTVGLSTGHNKVVVRGEPASRSFSVVYMREGRVIALDCVNMVRDYVQGRKLVEAKAAPDIARLQDPAVPLKALL